MISSDVFKDANVKPSTHFKRSEFACKCGCGFDTVDTTLIQVLDYIRSNTNAPIIVTSGCRCSAHNKAIGGAENSKHLQGRAADIKCPDIMWETLRDIVDEYMNDWGGVGYYQNGGWIHIDTRSGDPARWHGG